MTVIGGSLLGCQMESSAEVTLSSEMSAILPGYKRLLKYYQLYLPHPTDYYIFLLVLH